MKKKLTIVMLLVLLFSLPMFGAAQQSMSEGSLQTSSQNSSQESTGASSENSSQYSTEGSSKWSTDTTSNSPQASTDATTNQSSGNSNSATVAVIVVGAVVSVALTVGGIILTVHVSKAKKENVLRLQDQIYLADGKDYRDILTFFELDDQDLIEANDQLVAAGRQIGSDQDAADYLAALMLELAKRSQKVQRQLRVL
jgi:hypothetical protein